MNEPLLTLNDWPINFDREMGFPIVSARGNWEAGRAAWIASTGARGIKCSLSAGWDGVVSLTMIAEIIKILPYLESIEIYHPAATGELAALFTALQQLHLKRLCIQVPKHIKIDLAAFGDLKILKIFWSNAITGLDQCTGLSELNIISYPYKNFEPIAGNAKTLLSLSVISNKLESLQGIDSFKHLQELDLHDCRALQSIDQIKNHPAITVIRISSCKALQSIQSLLTLTHLQQVEVEKCPALEDELTPWTQRTDLPFALLVIKS